MDKQLATAAVYKLLELWSFFFYFIFFCAQDFLFLNFWWLLTACLMAGNVLNINVILLIRLV